MNFDSIQNAAKTKGQLVFAMDQGQQDIPMMAEAGFGVGQEGYCMGLSLRWISEMYAGRNLPFSPMTGTYDEVDWFALQLFGRYVEMPASVIDTDTLGWKNTTAMLSMSVSPGLRAWQFFQAPSGRFICTTARRAWGCYGITLSSKNKGNHAIAVRHARDNAFHLFDPNYGHFAVKWVDKFQAFLDGYFAATGYATLYNNVAFITGVRPPNGSPGSH